MMNWINKKRNKKGFTLVELVVVIAILGILAAIAVPRLTNLRHEATVKAEGATAVSIANAARIQETSTGETVADKKLESQYMSYDESVYTITKPGDLYIITWTTGAKGSYVDQKLKYTEGTEFTAKPNEQEDPDNT